MNNEHDEPWTLYSIIEYVSENFIGLSLLILAFVIIYVVDHINQLNAIMMSSQIQIPIKQLSSSKTPNPMKVKSKKLKKQ
jgi:hypothetical protein